MTRRSNGETANKPHQGFKTVPARVHLVHGVTLAEGQLGRSDGPIVRGNRLGRSLSSVRVVGIFSQRSLMLQGSSVSPASR